MSRDPTPLRPFWSYYGGKFRMARHLPPPKYGTIVEPFAGSAGYALNYPDRDVVLVDKYPVITEMWRTLIQATPDEVMAIPEVTRVKDLPGWVSKGWRNVVAFNLGRVDSSPRKCQASGVSKDLARNPNVLRGWTRAVKESIASQVNRIKHWVVIPGSYQRSPDVTATWFVDPPYTSPAGARYVHNAASLDLSLLGSWCKSRKGQVIVCEAQGALWLPFRALGTFQGGPQSKGSREAIWTQG